MTHFATADELGDDLLPAQLERFTRVRRTAARTTRIVVHAANSAATFRDPVRTSTWCAAGSPSTGSTPSSGDPATRARARAVARVVAGRGARFEAGDGRRLRAPLDGAASPPGWRRCPIGYGDGWRRGAVERLRRAGRRPAPPAGGHREHGQRDGRPGARPEVRSATPAVLIGAQGDERILCRGGGAAAGHDQLRGHLRPDRRGCAGVHAQVTDPRIRGARTGGRLAGRRDDARRAAGRPVDDLDLAVDGDPEAAARPWRGSSAARSSGSRSASAPGG